MAKDCPCSWCRQFGDSECPRYNLEREIGALMKQVKELEDRLESTD